jgi:nucleotide-binding universal stress UspA family protein
MFKRVLVPLDGSSAAETVLPYVELLAGRAGAEVHLLTVVADAAEATGTGDAFAYLERQVERLRASSISCQSAVTAGEPGDTILAEADARDADLVAMSTHGRSGLTRWVLGSVADKVIHRADRPLLLVRAHDGADKPAAVIDRVLVPLDGSPLSLSVLPYVEQVAETLRADLVLYNGVPPLDVYPGAETTPARFGNVIDDLVTQGKEFLGQVEREVKERGKVEARGVVTIGFAVDEIVRVAGEVNAGLIAMATHGRSGLDRWVMGSVADGVVRRSSLPCLLVRPVEAGRKER